MGARKNAFAASGDGATLSFGFGPNQEGEAWVTWGWMDALPAQGGGTPQPLVGELG